ncbi:hypothetical protein WA026_023399, partial [Henosepilachna vigintioctopunctata]
MADLGPHPDRRPIVCAPKKYSPAVFLLTSIRKRPGEVRNKKEIANCGAQKRAENAQGKTKAGWGCHVIVLVGRGNDECGEDMIKALMDYFEKENELDLKKLLSTTTDGAPAMAG